MKTTEATFKVVLLRMLQELETLEKACKKAFLKIRKLADAPEFAKALHEDQTGIIDHMGRLKLIQTEMARKTVKPTKTDRNDLHLSEDKKIGPEKDLWLIASAQQIIQQKIALYKLVHRIASQQQLVHSPVLVEQTIKENEATSTWLDRIAQRILNGESIVPQEHL